MEWSFPVYRKYPGEVAWFKILSLEAFEEIQLAGQTFAHRTIEVSTHPERMRILDMLNNEGGYWEETDEAAFAAALADSRNTRREIP